MSSTTRKPFSLAIVGGGITGVILAIALSRRGIRCSVYEQAQAFGEAGAGVAIHSGAVRALRLCSEDLVTAFDGVATTNSWASKKPVWFDFFDGTSEAPAADLEPLFTISSTDGEVPFRAAHRARFLDAMVGLLPEGIAHFRKRLRDITDDRASSGMMTLHFEDGSTAQADAVLGCDGIKSRTREVMVGPDRPEAKSRYSHKYAYRALIPMDSAVEVLGAEKAQNSCMWLGPGRHVLTIPVDQGRTLNLVAFVTDDKEWPSSTQMALPSTREEAQEDFKSFGASVRKLIDMTEERPDRWALFDLAEHPLGSFCKGRVCLVGDAAHACTPHHGAGAGFCMEDAAVLAALLADESVRGAGDLEAVFAAFDACRRGRDQWLVQSSRRNGDVYELRHPDTGSDLDKIRKDLSTRMPYIWGVDMDREIEESTRTLRETLGAAAP